jgi:hypothetical protein
MATGTPTHTDASLTEPWRERTPQAVLAAKAARLRSRIAETCTLAKGARGMSAKNLPRRCLADAENLLDLVDEALRQDWIDG